MKAKGLTKIPAELFEALTKDAAVRAAFEQMPLSHRAEYVKYIGEAKKGETRVRRAEKAVEMIRKRAREHGAGR